MIDFPDELSERIEKIYDDMDKALEIVGRSSGNIGDIIPTHYALFKDLFQHLEPIIKEQVRLYKGIKSDYEYADKILYVIAGMNIFFGLEHQESNIDETDGLKLKTWENRAVKPKKTRKSDYMAYNIEHLGTYAKLLGYSSDTKKAINLLSRFKTQTK